MSKPSKATSKKAAEEGQLEPRRWVGAWRLEDLAKIRRNGLRVFSCFHCGGGSTMGYKLAGYEVLGGVEIDPQMMEIYRRNHRPRHSFLMGVQDFVKDGLIPEGLQDLDILDGSPPCSSFSMSGAREKKWGKKAHFREGQAAQVLDDLFFEFIRVARVLRPRVVVAENVKGLITGKARGYVKEIFAGFKEAGYSAQLFLLNAACMGVPQARERTFFIATRNDLGRRLELGFHEPPIPLGDILVEDVPHHHGLWPCFIDLLNYVKPGDRGLSEAYKRKTGKTGYFNNPFQFLHRPAPTVTAAKGGVALVFPHMRALVDEEFIAVQTFPTDFDFVGQRVKYVCGMSVPPFMMQRVALEVGRQLLGVDYNRAAPTPLSAPQGG